MYKYSMGDTEWYQYSTRSIMGKFRHFFKEEKDILSQLLPWK